MSLSDTSEDRVVWAAFLIWRCVPCGYDRLTFTAGGEVLLRRACGCCCDERPLPPQPQQLEVRKQPLCSAARLLRDAGLAFVLSFLFHLVVSIVWGAARSLGSAENHQLMGAVWFGGWPAWFVAVQLLRPWGLVVHDRQARVHVHGALPLGAATRVPAWRAEAACAPRVRAARAVGRPRGAAV